MLLSSARLALGDVFSPPFRAALWKTLGLTALVLVILWFAVRFLFERIAIPFFAGYAPDMPAWVDNAGTFAGIAASIALAFLLAFLIAPVSAVIAGLFLDDVAEVAEREHYPGQPVGEALPFVTGLVTSVKFFGIVILGNLLAFALLWVPFVNLAAFFVVNGYLLGREYFEFAALRYRPDGEAKALRARYGGTVMAAGLVIAAFLAVPILNLLTPLFAAAFMVHLHHRVSDREGGLPLSPARRPDAVSPPRPPAGVAGPPA
jgi:CysZ protein